MRFIIDTNVALAANNKADVGPACVLRAIERLERLMVGEVIVLDDAFLILTEYGHKLNPKGQPGPGDAFFQWVLQHTRVLHRCEQVALALAEDGSFAAYPPAAELSKFDRADRKFVALALTHPARPPIVNACDKDWHEHHEALGTHGVDIEFLCPEEMTRPRRQ